MREPTRTDIVDATLRKIEEFSKSAILQRTMARSFSDYADDVRSIPTKGDVADLVAKEIEAWCRQKSQERTKDAKHCESVVEKYKAELTP